MSVDFGKYAVLDNPEYTFRRDESLKWKFRPTTAEDEIEIQRWIQEQADKKIEPTWVEIAMKQLSIMSVSTNIPGAGLEEGGSRVQFEELLRQIPLDMFGELWIALGEINPLWGPPRPPQTATVQS